ncbi:MAG: RNA ligase [Haloarculaceae archaeon]
MVRDPATALDVDVSAEDLKEHFERNSFRGREYVHLPDARHGLERGTAVFEDAVVRGYPSIPRVLVLDPGVPDFFAGVDEVIVEEKLNGYNVRVVRVDGDRLALTRGGYVCPWTTALVRERVPDAFFEEHPEACVCVEVVGEENPYTTFSYPEVDGAGIRVFDVRERTTGEPYPVRERRDRCGAYDLPQVGLLGRYDREDAVGSVREQVESLDERGREGVALTSPAGRDVPKYTTSAIHRADLAHAFALPFDYGRDFLFARIVREAFQAVEFDEEPDAIRERARDLGESLLVPAVETIREVRDGGTAGETHTVRGSPAVVDELLRQFRDHGLEIEVEAEREDGDERVVTFTKVARSSQDRIQHFLEGGTIDE